MEVRDAGEGDIPTITRIYNDAVEHSTAIWNDVTIDAANRLAWLSDRPKAGYPVLVAVDGAEVLGYASFGDWRAWDGYRHRSSIRCMCVPTSAARVSARR